MRSKEFWQYYESANPQLGSRAATFAKALDYLDRLSRPVGMVESGCMRPPGGFAEDGGSTLLFDTYAEFRAGSVIQPVDMEAGLADSF